MSSLIDCMGQVNALKNGVGIQSLLNEAHRILGNPLFLFNLEYELLSYTETVTDDSLWNELVTQGMFSPRTLEFFKNEGFIEDYANAKRITLMVSDKLKYDRLSGKVLNKNNTQVACLVAVACEKPFEPHDPAVFEAVCKLVTKEISKSEHYETYEKLFYETVIKVLIDESVEDKELYMAHLEILYNHLKANLYVAVVDISPCDPDHTQLVYFRDLFQQVQAGYTYAIYANYIVILLSTHHRSLSVSRDLSKLSQLFGHHQMYAGISDRFENLFALRKSYQEALTALQYISESRSCQRIFPYERSAIDLLEQIRALKNGMGVQYLLNEACQILGNPVLLHDMELKFLSCTENVEVDDPLWEEFLTYGVLGDQTIDFLHSEGFTDAIVNADSCAFMRSEKLKHDRMSGKIFNKDHVMIGCVVEVACHHPLRGDERAIFSAFCEVLSREVGQTALFNRYGQAYAETLVSKLIDGNISGHTLFTEGVTSIYNNLKDNLYLAVVDTTLCDPEHSKIEYFRDLLKQLQTSYRYAVYSHYILMIISLRDRSFNANKELYEMNQLFEQNHIYAGISSRFGNIYELQKHYAEAVTALYNGMKNKKPHGNRRIFLYDEV